MSKYKVGDKVRILSTKYNAFNLTVGSVHDVVDVGSSLTLLEATYKDGSTSRLAFCSHEIEPYTAKIARLVRELNSALAESKDDLEVEVNGYWKSIGILTQVIAVTKKERIA